MAGRSATLILLVLVLQILNLILFLLDHDIDHLKVFHLLSLMSISVHIVEELSCFVLLAKLDLLLELMLLLFHLIDAFDQIHVVFHEAGIVFAMLLQTA